MDYPTGTQFLESLVAVELKRKVLLHCYELHFISSIVSGEVAKSSEMDILQSWEGKVTAL